MKTKNFLILYKSFFGLLGASALVTEIIVLVGRGRFVPENFFSFFTVESNLFACVILLIGAVMAWRRKRSKVFTMLRGAATLYMVLTGIVFAVMLSGLQGVELTAVPWDNLVLHYIMPIAVVVDWLIDRPSIRMAFKRALVWLAFPILYMIYTLIRGMVVEWYPYPFLNPTTNGYLGIFIISLGIAILAAGIVWMLTRSKILRAS
jgi:hypothetical protein